MTVILNNIENMISRTERNKLNENWERIIYGLTKLQRQINLLTGEDIDVILSRIDEAIEHAINATQDAIDANDTATQEAINSMNQAVTVAIGSINGVVAELNQKLIDVDLKVAEVDETILAINSKITEINNAVEEANQLINKIKDVIANFVSKGKFVVGTQYYKNNIVSDDAGNSYIAKEDNINIGLQDASKWSLLASKGEKGDKGDIGETGAGLNIKGALTDTSKLPSTGELGDAYMISGSLYTWSADSHSWVNVGNIKGEKGDKGDRGDTGKSAYQEARTNGFIGTEVEWLASLKGVKGDKGDTGNIQPALDEINKVKESLSLHTPKIASTTALGHIKVGKNLTITTDGTLNAEAGGGSAYVLPVATKNTLGGVMPDGLTLTTSSSGEIGLSTNMISIIVNHQESKNLHKYHVSDSLRPSSVTGNAEGYQAQAKGGYSHAEGYRTTASGDYSHAEGVGTTASGDYSHVEGSGSISSGSYSHAEGSNNTSSGFASHTEGANNKAVGNFSHAEGSNNTATGNFSHAEGSDTVALGTGSHAEGMSTRASGSYSHSGGFGTEAYEFASTAIGQYNLPTYGTQLSHLSSNTAFVIGNGSSSTKANAFRVIFNGTTYSQGSFNSWGADYAEYFEWSDGNSENEERIGYFVTLDGEQIRKATSSDDYIVGVISVNPSVVGDSYQDNWKGMYITDEWNRIQYHFIDVEYTELDEEGNEVTKVRQDYMPMINPEYDSEAEYVARENRKEWDAVGMMGKLLVRDDGTCEVNSFCMPNDEGIATSSDNGFRVIGRISDNIVKVLVK